MTSRRQTSDLSTPPDRAIALGPLNTASQATAWSRGLQDNLNIRASTLGFDRPLGRLRGRRLTTPPDTVIPHYRMSTTSYRRRVVRRSLRTYTHLLNESNFPLFLTPNKHQFTDELEQYSADGIHVGIIFHGSDIRDPGLSMETNPDSYFYDANPEWVYRLSTVSSRNRTAVQNLDIPKFVTTPDLLDHLPGSLLLPITINAADWETAPPNVHGRKLRVLHRPSSAQHPTKGSKYIIPVLEKLERSGLIDVVHSDIVTHAKMRSLLARTDVVVDQLQTGAYGAIAVEALAASRVVVANLSKTTLDALGGSTPIVNTSIQEFETSIVNLCRQPDLVEELARRGPSFVRKWHDGSMAAHRLGQFSRSSP